MQHRIRTISPTRLRAYDDCPLQYRLRYVDRAPRVDSPASLAGQAVHAALEHVFTVKRRWRRFSADEACEVYDDVWDERLPPGASSDASAAEFEQAYASGLAALRLYLEQVAPGVSPHLIEHRFRFDVPGLPVQVVGTVDLIDSAGVVIDYKTSLTPYAASYLDRDLQLRCYAIGYAAFRAGSRVRPGELPAPFFVPTVRVDVLVRGDPPSVQQFERKFGRADLEDFAARASDIIAGIEAEAFEPYWTQAAGDPDPSTCRRCAYGRTCEASLARRELLENGGEDGDEKEEE